MRPPGYWRNESSGVLAPAVKRYLAGESLTLREIGLLRAYFRQWVDSPVWDQNPHQAPRARGGIIRAARLRRRDRDSKRPRAMGGARRGIRDGSAMKVAIRDFADGIFEETIDCDSVDLERLVSEHMKRLLSEVLHPRI